MKTMTTEDIITAYEAQRLEEDTIIQQKNKNIQKMAESREAAITRKKRIEEMKNRIQEKRKLMKEKTEVEGKIKKTLKEDVDDEFEIEEPAIEVDDDEEIEGEEDEDEVIEGEEDEDDEEEVQKESKQAILKKIAERKRQDILKKISERKAKAEGVQKVEEKKEPVKEKKEVRVGTLLEAAEGDKKRRFSVFREEKDSFYLKELGTGKTFKIKKEKVELTD